MRFLSAAPKERRCGGKKWSRVRLLLLGSLRSWETPRLEDSPRSSWCVKPHPLPSEVRSNLARIGRHFTENSSRIHRRDLCCPETRLPARRKTVWLSAKRHRRKRRELPMQEGRARRVVTILVIAALVVSVIVLLVFVPSFRTAVISVLNWLGSQGLSALGALWRVLAPVVGAVIFAGVLTLIVYFVARSLSRSIPIPLGIIVFLIGFVATIPGIAGATVSSSLGLAAGVLAALIALLGVIFAQSLNAYSAWITQRRELAGAR